MSNQLKVCFYKLRKSLFLYLSALGFFTAAVMVAVKNIFVDKLDISGQVVLIHSLSDTSLLFIITLFVSYFLGKDFANRTIDNEIRIGYSRWSVLLSRIIVALPFSAILYLFYSVPYALIVGASNGFNGNMKLHEIIIRIVLFALQVMAITSFAVLIVFWCKKSSLGIMLSVCFTVITCNILRNFLDDAVLFRATSFYRIQMNMVKMTSQDIITSFVSAIITIFIVLFATYIIFRKTELK
jgi:ABC-type transport system involved in multi-copper enzyme maturation permease subunit